MKLEFKEFSFETFKEEMTKLKDEKHFDYLVTIIGEDFGKEEGLGCIYLLENTDTHERISVKQMAKQVGDDYVRLYTMYGVPLTCWSVRSTTSSE